MGDRGRQELSSLYSGKRFPRIISQVSFTVLALKKIMSLLPAPTQTGGDLRTSSQCSEVRAGFAEKVGRHMACCIPMCFRTAETEAQADDDETLAYFLFIALCNALPSALRAPLEPLRYNTKNRQNLTVCIQDTMTTSPGVPRPAECYDASSPDPILQPYEPVPRCSSPTPS